MFDKIAGVVMTSSPSALFAPCTPGTPMAFDARTDVSPAALRGSLAVLLVRPLGLLLLRSGQCGALANA